MKINLRKASIVQDLLQDEIGRFDQVPYTVHPNLFETNICEQVQQQLVAFEEAQAKVEVYQEARRVLRTLVAKYNAKAGINELLAEDAMLASRERRQRNIVTNSKPRLSDEAINRQLESLLQSDEYSRSIKLDVLPVETITAIEDRIEAIKRRRRKIKDQLLVINITTEIEVPKKVATLIKELGLD